METLETGDSVETRHDIPTHLTVPDRPLLGLTAPQLLVLAGGVFSLLAALRQPHVPLGARLAEGFAAIALALLIALLRPRGRSLLSWSRLAVGHRTGPRALIWIRHAAARPLTTEDPVLPRPPHLAPRMARRGPAPAPPPHPPSQPPTRAGRAGRRPAIQTAPFVPTAIADGIVALSGGQRCAVLECTGPNTALMDAAALAVLHARYHTVLVGLQFPLQVVVSTTPADLRRYRAAREERLRTLPLALRRLESSDISFMGRAAQRLSLVDHRAFVVIPAPIASGPDPARVHSPFALLHHSGGQSRGALVDERAVARVLDDRCLQVATALRSAGVHAWRLDTAALRELWYRRLCPRTALLQPLDAAHGTEAITRTIIFDHDEDKVLS